MTAYRVVVTQKMRKSEDDRDFRDASFTEYHKSLKRAGFTVARFEDCQNDTDRILESILVEVIHITDSD